MEKITQLKVEYDNHTYNLLGSGNDTSTTWSVNGISIGEDSNKLFLTGDVKPGDRVWLVYAVWSDGDSERHDENCKIDFISVHRDEYIARMNAEALCDVDEDEVAWGHTVDLIMDDSAVISYCLPWIGCFESLSWIKCEPFTVQRCVHGNTYLPKKKRYD